MNTAVISLKTPPLPPITKIMACELCRVEYEVKCSPYLVPDSIICEVCCATKLSKTNWEQENEA